MNTKLKVVTIMGALVVGVMAGSMLNSKIDADGETVTPGSIDDPVVTKSYVDQKIAGLSGSGQSGSGAGSGSNSGTTTDTVAPQSFEVVTVPVGKRVIALDSAEFVVRAGKAIVFSGDVNGVSDLTAGTDILNGGKVENNHLLLSARGGRGLSVSPEQKSGSMVVLVRGQYELQDQPS